MNMTTYGIHTPYTRNTFNDLIWTLKHDFTPQAPSISFLYLLKNSIFLQVYTMWYVSFTKIQGKSFKIKMYTCSFR